MNRLVASLLSVLLLTACLGGSDDGETSSSTSCFKEYWDGSVGVCLPRGWNVIDPGTLRQRGAPEETVVAFQADEPASGQFPTITITREPLADPVVPSVYSDASIRSVAVLPEYEHSDTLTVEIDSFDVKLHIFTAQPVDGEPKRRFYQVSTFAEDAGYTLTAAIPVTVDTDLENAVLDILRSATFSKEEEEAAPEDSEDTATE